MPTVPFPQYEFHPLCLLFPEADESTFAELKASIKANGFNPSEAIILHEDKILDGRTPERNRHTTLSKNSSTRN